MRLDGSHVRGGGYGHQSGHGLERSSKFPSQQPGEQDSALPMFPQDDDSAFDAFHINRPGRVLGGGGGILLGSPSAQAALAAEKRRLQFREQLSRHSTSSDAPASTMSCSANPSATSLSSYSASMHHDLSTFATGAPSVQTQVTGARASEDYFSTGSAYSMSIGETTAQPFFGLPTLDIAQVDNVGDVVELDMDMDDDFMAPFPSP